MALTRKSPFVLFWPMILNVNVETHRRLYQAACPVLLLPTEKMGSPSTQMGLFTNGKSMSIGFARQAPMGNGLGSPNGNKGFPPRSIEKC